MATTSQKMMEIRFLVRIRGALTPPPRIEVPVMKIPLVKPSIQYEVVERNGLYLIQLFVSGIQRTMQLQRPKVLCTTLFPCLPMSRAILIRGIGQPMRQLISPEPLPHHPIRARSYIECFSFPIKQHICTSTYESVSISSISKLCRW